MRSDDRAQYLLDHFVQPTEMLPLGESVVSGLKAGGLGGIVVTAIVAVAYRSADLLPFRVLAYGLTGSESVANSAAGIALAILAQLAWTIALGALFGVVMAKLIGRVGTAIAEVVGIIYGLLVWILGQYVVVGFLTPQAVTLNDQHLLAAAHLVYGLCLGLFFLVEQSAPGD